MNFKKISSWLLFVPLLTGCFGGQETKSKASSNEVDKYLKTNQKLPEVAYVTTGENIDQEFGNNPIGQILHESILKYDYTIVTKSPTNIINYHSAKEYKGDPDYTTGQQVVLALKKMARAKIDTAFIETNPLEPTMITNDKALYQAVKDKVFSNRIALIGENSATVNGDKTRAWKAFDNVATFAYSPIISAYMTGYQVQSNFGRFSNSKNELEKRSVGYLVAAFRTGTDEQDKENILKANAFREGVKAAVEDQKTGPASFVRRQAISDAKEKRNLLWADDEIADRVNLAKDQSNYAGKDHSIFYLAGADSEMNYIAAQALATEGVINDYGHKMVVEEGASTDGQALEAGATDLNLVTGRSKNANVVARIKMVYDGKGQASSTDTYMKTQAFKKIATEAVLMSLYGPNVVDYFGRHNQIGAFATIDNVKNPLNPNDPSVVDAQAQANIIGLKEKLIYDILNKGLTVDKFKDTFINV